MYDSLQRGTVQFFSFALFSHRISSVSTEQWRIGVTNCVRGVELATLPNFRFPCGVACAGCPVPVNSGGVCVHGDCGAKQDAERPEMVSKTW